MKYLSSNQKTCAILLVSIVLMFTFIIMFADVSEIGPAKTAVGLSHLNKLIADRTGFNESWYKITQAIGYLALAVAAGFAVLGLVQWIKRKHILKVDARILALGVFFIVVIAIYFLFTKVAVNYRPIIMPGETEPEPSFPSSHTLLAVSVFGGACMVLDEDYIKNNVLRIIVRVALIAVILVMVVGRILSGVHWFTDILAGIVYGALLLYFYYLAVTILTGKAAAKKEE